MSNAEKDDLMPFIIDPVQDAAGAGLHTSGAPFRALSAPSKPICPFVTEPQKAQKPPKDGGFLFAPGVGLEPTTNGLTVRCSAELSYPGMGCREGRSMVSDVRPDG